MKGWDTDYVGQFFVDVRILAPDTRSVDDRWPFFHSIFSVINLHICFHFAPHFSFLVVFKIIYFSFNPWAGASGVLHRQTGTDTAFPVISPGGGGRLTCY